MTSVRFKKACFSTTNWMGTVESYTRMVLTMLESFTEAEPMDRASTMMLRGLYKNEASGRKTF